MDYLLEAVFVVVFLLLIFVYLINRKLDKVFNAFEADHEVLKTALEEAVKKFNLPPPPGKGKGGGDENFDDFIDMNVDSVEELFNRENSGSAGKHRRREDDFDDNYGDDYDPL